MPLHEKQLTGLAPLTIATRGVKRYHIDQPDQPLTEDVTRPWIGCIWELAPFEHERAAWARHVLSPEQPDVASYMSDTMPDGLVGT